MTPPLLPEAAIKPVTRPNGRPKIGDKVNRIVDGFRQWNAPRDVTQLLPDGTCRVDGVVSPIPDRELFVEAPGDDAADAPIKPSVDRPEAADLPGEVKPLAAVLRELAGVLPELKAALGRRPRVEPLAYRLDELADALGVSRRLLERERSAGRFPPADRTIGRVPLWKRETVAAYLDSRKGDR